METKMDYSEAPFNNIHKELIDGCKKGDQKSQFRIYKLYYKAMYVTSLKIVKDQMEAEDIMQEAFLTAFEKIGSYSGSVSFGVWLRKIVYNRSIDALRKKKQIVFEPIENYQECEENCHDISESAEESEIKINKVKEAIRLLPEKCRNIISLHLFEGYDHDEIGEVLSISSSTSRSQYSRARQRLLKEFEGR